MPGKYETNSDKTLAEILDSIISNGFASEELGSVDELGHYAKVEHENRFFIVNTDNDGFVDVEEYDTETAREAIWNEIVESYEAFDAMEGE
jgi:hypothetical protein